MTCNIISARSRHQPRQQVSHLSVRSEFVLSLWLSILDREELDASVGENRDFKFPVSDVPFQLNTTSSERNNIRRLQATWSENRNLSNEVNGALDKVFTGRWAPIAIPTGLKVLKSNRRLDRSEFPHVVQRETRAPLDRNSLGRSACCRLGSGASHG